MKKTFTQFLAALALLAFFIPSLTAVGQTTYEQLTSIASIDETAQYVLGIDGTGFHYEGTSNWGKTALPSAQTPIYYTLTKAADDNSFTAQATISGTTYYLQIPTSNTFSMATSTGTNTDIIIGTTQVSETNYAVANKNNTARHLRINGTSGLRSYAGTTGNMAYFYKVVASGPSITTNPTTISWNDSPINEQLSQVITLTSSNITGDITASTTIGSITWTTQNESATLTYTPTTAGDFSGTVTFVNGETTATVTVTGSAYDPSNVDTYERYTSAIVEGDYVIYNTNGAMKSELNNGPRFNNQSVTISGNTITNPDASVVWHIAPSGDYWTIYNASVNKYAGGTTSKNQGALLDDATDNHALWIITYQYSNFTIENYGRSQDNSDPTNRYLRQNNTATAGWATYTSGTGYVPQLYKKVVANQVAMPSFDPVGGTYYETQSVTLSCETSDATIYYTTDGTTPSTLNGTAYTKPISVSTTTTIKAIAVKSGMTDSDLAIATYTIEQPYSTIPALFDAATNVEQDIRVTFGNWIVSGVSTNGRNVYVTDNSSNGFIIYFTSDMSSTFSEGSILSGTAVACKLKKYNGAAELIDLNANDLTITTGGTVTTANIAMADLSGINTGALVSYNNLTCSLENNKYYLSDGTTTVQAYNTLYAFNEFEADKIYNVTGVYVQYNNIKEIAPRSAADIVEVTPASVSYQYSINGVLDPTVYNCAVGSTKTLETGSDLYSDFTFAGWTTDPNDVSQHLTEYTFQDANPVTFYAVYGHITPGTINSSAKGYEVYSQVTNVGSLTSMGEYLITSKITGNNSDYPYLFNGLSGQNQYVAGTYAGNSIISDLPAGAAIVNISTHSDANNVSGFSIRISGNTSNNLDRYIGGTSGTSTMNFSNNPILNIISFDENGNADIVSNTSHLRLDEPNGEFCYYTQPESKNTIQLYKKVTNYYTRVLNETATADIYLLGPSIIPSYGVLDMATYEIDRESGSFSVPYLIIEEGGQFIYKGDDIKCEVQKSITKPSGTWGQDDNTGWYAISSPVGRISKYSEIDYFEYILNNVKMFDYFAYGEDFGWYNKIDEDTYVREMKAGHGYLYARAENTMLFFRSETDRDDCDLTNLSYTSSRGNLAGLHFIGNPYTHNIYKGVGITGDMTTGYYALNEATGAWISTTDNTPIVPMQAVMVFVNKTDGTAAIHMTSDNSAPSTKSNNDYIQFTVGNNEYEDVAYAWFDNGEGLRKINHRNSEIPMVYIPQGDINYSIATMNDNTQSFNLNFKAMTTGQYTLSYKTQGEFNYMHIYDRLTGVDVDMLLEGEYSFIGSPSDNDARFIVSLGYMPNYNGDDNFVYQNGNDIIVNGEGELQVFDVTGRMVMKTMVEGVQTVNMLSNGVYVFRMIGENVKTQKIVVR